MALKNRDDSLPRRARPGYTLYNVLTFIGDYYKHPTPVIVEGRNEQDARMHALIEAKRVQDRQIELDREFRATVPEERRDRRHPGHTWDQPPGFSHAGPIRIDSVWALSGTLD